MCLYTKIRKRVSRSKTVAEKLNIPSGYQIVIERVSSDRLRDHLHNNATSASGSATVRVNGSGSRGLRVGGIKDNGGEFSEEIHWWVSN